MDEDDLEPLDPTLQNIIDQESLEWIFVGGKGGVGKTTTSCCIAVRLSKVRENVLVISTDPAHNLSDAFGQKFGRDPTAVQGIPNLFCMEIDPKMEVEDLQGDGTDDGGMGSMGSMFQDLTQSIPGIDEAMGFAEIMKQVQTMNFSCIVFDTAPTGHTLRLLSFPTTLEKAFDKLMGLKNKFSGMFGQVASMFNGQMPSEEQLMGKLEATKQVIQKVNAQFKDPDKTTFVCVCIPEFLSLYETERLVQELTKFEIDTHNIVVNQVLFPERDIISATENLQDQVNEDSIIGSCVRKVIARQRMQRKYIDQIYDLYEDFHVTQMPLLDSEVRGVEKLEDFSKYMLEPLENED
jgi:arsenite-transporting ATPase